MTQESADAESRKIYAFERNLVLAASAGTGKTHALVGVAVHLLLGACKSHDGGLRPPLAPDALVATTFSRKAAGEIRARISEVLERLATEGVRAPYRADLDAARISAGVSPFTDAEVATLARRARSGLGRAKIGTLHSFAVWIVRQNALLLGMSPDFEIPDEETTRERMTRTIEHVLEERATDPGVASLIALGGGVAALVDLTRRLLLRVAEDGRTAGELALPAGDAAAIDALFQQVLLRTRDLAGEPKLGEAARAVLTASGAGDASLLEEAMGALWSVSKAGKQSSSAEAFFDLRDQISHTSAGTKLRDRGRALVRRWRVRDRILPHAETMKRLLVACEAEVASSNATDSMLGFADILRAARDVLRDHPEVAEETGALLGALLVDEFQDTSALQRDLLLLLWERHGGDAGLTRAPGAPAQIDAIRREGLLIVGDRKQSIYGFRGADVAVFAELCIGLAGDTARVALGIPMGLVPPPADPSADFIALRHNRRGVPELLDFANALSHISLVPAGAAPELYEVSYVAATEDLLSPPGLETDDAPAERTPRTWWLRLPVPTKKATTSLLREAEAIATRIEAIVRGGDLTVRGAPAKWRDVAVLAPRHEALSAATYALARAGIPHVVAGMGFFGAREVRDVVSMLACLVDADDSLSRVEVLRGPWAGVTDRTLVALTDRHAGVVDVTRWTLGERRLLVDPQDRHAIASLARVILSLRPVVSRIGPGAALREAARALSFEETLTLLPRGEQRVANVRKLLAIADDATLGVELLHRLRQADAREQKEGEAVTFSDEDDAVRLLTVHASKGLAFPIVFLPDVGATARPRPSDAMFVRSGAFGGAGLLVTRVLDDVGSLHETPSYGEARQDAGRREAAERRRLRYVATTRASSAMFFVGDRTPSKGGRDAYASTTAGLLARLATDEASKSAARFAVETEERAFQRLPEAAASPATLLGSYRHLPFFERTDGPIAIDADALVVASHCVRHYQLRDAAAPPASRFATPSRTTPELLGVLRSAGAWGARMTTDAPRSIEQETLVLTTEDGARRRASVTVEGTICVSWDDGAVDAILLNPAKSDDLYASVVLHAIRAHATSTKVRVGILAPDGSSTEDPRWIDPRPLDATRASIHDVAARILAVPHGELAPRVPVPVCRATACPYLESCHPYGEQERASPELRRRSQTAFDFFEEDLRRNPTRTKRVRRLR